MNALLHLWFGDLFVSVSASVNRIMKVKLLSDSQSQNFCSIMHCCRKN